MTDGLKSEYRRTIIETLSANPKVERIVLFGSRAMGTFTPTSDIDLALFGDDLTLSDQAALAEAMAELAIPQRVDILIHHRIENQALREHIRKHGVEWFARKQASGTPAAARVRRNYSSNRPKPPNSTPPSPPTSRSWVMADEWRQARFGEIAEILPGKYIPSSDYDPAGGYVIYGSNSIMGRVRLPLYDGPIIAFARIGSNCGATMYSAAACWINNNAAGIRAKAGYDTRFLYYWMQSFDFAQIREGSGQPYISDRTLEELVLLLPPLPEQRAIAHILGTLDDKIELNRRMSETLEAMARALFKAWFVDFDPVRAKMEGRWQRGQSLPGLPAHLYDLFPDRLVDSELGEIPEGWEVGTLGDVAENPRRGVQPDSVAPDTPYIALEHMPRRCIALSDWGSAEGIESNKFEFRKGEILFGKLRPYFHKVGVAPVDGVCSTDIVVVCPRTPHWFAFVLCVVSSDDFVEFTNAGSTGTKMPRTSWADMARYEIALPPDALAQAFNGIVRRQVDRLIAAVHESRTLAALRDALLPKLIRGEIRVKDAERFLEERGL